MKDKDFEKMKAITTDDFVLFEDGKVWNNDSLINLINSMPDFTAVYSFKDFNINIDVQNANMYYLNHMDLTLNDTTEVKYDWIESATFRKKDGIWKMNFLHSTVRK